MNQNFPSRFKHACIESRRDKRPLSVRGLKLSEECGELSEAIAHQEGWLPLKQMKEPLIGEVADVIITAIDVLRDAHPTDISDEELMNMLDEWLKKKLDKWTGIVDVKEKRDDIRRR